MAGRLEWVLLAYRLPQEPSTPRVTLWRKLRRLGVIQLHDGLVALPADARTREQLEWLADEVTEAGGAAALWLGRPASVAHERELATRMAEAVAEDYRLVRAEAAAAAGEAEPVRRRTLARLRRELRRLAQRDYFPPVDKDEARRAVETLAAAVEPAP